MAAGRDLLETWFERVWHQRQADAPAALLAPDCPVGGLGREVLRGPEAFCDFQSAMLALLESMQFSIDHSLEQDDWVHARCSLRARGRDGHEAWMSGAVSLRHADGTILEAYNHWDFINFFEQLELLPPRTFAHCLQGQPVPG